MLTFPGGVALTAIAMAQERAAESARADRLFDDPWAAPMVRAATSGAAQSRPAPSWLASNATLGDIAPGLTGYVAMRTRWVDDQTLGALRDTGITQVVLLGAGLDTRAARLPVPHAVTLFTVDHPGVLAVVDQVLPATTCTGSARRVPVPADLAGDWPTALTGHGFTPGTPTIWVIEGVLMYLSEHEAARLLQTTRCLSPGSSRLLADLAHPNIHHNELFAPGRRSLGSNGSPIRSAIADPPEWFATHGWHARTVDPQPLANEYQRPLPPALDPRPADGPTFIFTEAWT